VNIVVALLVTGCGGSNPLSSPTFDVKVKLSAAAKAQLSALGARLRVVAYFDGDSWWRPLYAGGPFRAVFLGKDDIEIELDEVAHFRAKPFPQDQASELLWGHYFVTINVSSSAHNFLNCGAPEGASSEFADQVMEVDCKLIHP